MYHNRINTQNCGFRFLPVEHCSHIHIVECALYGLEYEASGDKFESQRIESNCGTITKDCITHRKQECACCRSIPDHFFFGELKHSHAKFSVYLMPIHGVTFTTGYSSRLLSALCIMLCVNTFSCFLYSDFRTCPFSC